MSTTDPPTLSVIIPTKDRVDTLMATLERVFEQQAASAFEVVIADNGSSDDTWQQLQLLRESAPVPLRMVSELRPGPAAARNAAVAASRGRILLLLGDDTAPASGDVVARHIKLHERADNPQHAVLGRITWTPHAPVTEFMRWLDTGGPQFHYFELSRGPVDPTNYFYSSHLSLSRELYEQSGGFDERFKLAAFEDTDLGIRLNELGMQLNYEPELEVWHDHPTTLSASLARAVRIGRSAAIFHRIRGKKGHARLKRPSLIKQVIAPIGAAPIGMACHLPWPSERIKHRVWWLGHRFRFAQGYRIGAREPL